MGGGGKGGTTTQTVSIPPEVMARYNAVNSRAEGLADTPFKQYGNTPDAFVAPINATQQAGIAGTSNAANLAQPFYGAATGLTMAGAQDVGPLSAGQIQQYQNPYTQAVVGSTLGALGQQFGQQQSQQQAEAIKAGAFGGDRAGLQRAALMGQQGLAASQAIAPLYQQGYQQAVQTAQGQQGVVAGDLARRMAAGQQIAGLGAGAQQSAISGAQAQLGAGTVSQQTDQAGKQALYNQFLQEQGYPFQVAQFLANIAMGTGALSGSTTSTQQPSGFFSDEKLKHNKEKVGKLDDGQDIYRYDMGDGRTQIGLLAQEVEKKHPEAVGVAGGYKTVDYGAATDDAADRSKLAYGGMASEGGAVLPERAGLGFALGGSAAFDQDYMKQLLANQQGMYSGLYGQVGTPRGAQGTPGGLGARVPASTLPVGKLATAGSPPQQRSSGFEQAVSTGEKFAKVGSAAKAASPYVFGGQNDKGERVPSIGERLRGLGQPEQGPSGAETGGEPISKVQEAAKDKLADLGGKIDISDGEDVIRDIVATGGRINKAGGGITGDEDNDAPEGIYKSEGPGINIPDEKSKNELAKPAQAPGGDSGGGLGSALGTAASAAKLAMMFLSSGGGVVPRHHKALGGSEIKDRNMAVPEQSEGLKVNDLTDTIDRSMDEERPRVAAEGLKPTEEKKGNFDFSVGRTLKFEGGLNPRDTNGTPSLYGINKAANPDVDFGTLTPQKATDIYKNRYWDAIGGDSLPPELAHVAFDTAVIAGPGRAKKIMMASNGDPLKFLDLREQFQNGLIERNPEKYGRYEKAWNNRTAELRRDVEQGIPQPGASNDGGLGTARLDATGVRPQTQALSYAPTDKPSNDLPKVITEGPKDTLALGAKTEETGVAPPRPNMKPGLSGPERNYQDPVSSPYRHMFEKVVGKDTSEALKSENFWIPMLAGVGSMLASKNPSFGGALGEGLVGGAAAYSSQQGQQADIAEKQARAEETMAKIVDGSFKSINGILHVRILLPGGGYDWMPFGEYLSTEKKPSVDPRVAPVIRQMETYQKSQKKEGDAEPGTTPLQPITGPGAPAPASTTPPAPGRPKEEAPAAPATVAPPAAPPAAPAPRAAPVEPKLSQSGVPLTIGLNAGHRDAASAAAKAMAGMDETTRNKALENDFFGPQQKVATAARGQQQQLIPMATVYASLPKDQSLATSGKAQEFLQPIVATLSNLAAMAGMPDAVINTEILASQEKVKKLVSELQSGRLNEAQLKAAQAFRDMAQGIPDIVNTPGGQAKQMSQLLTSAQRQIDKDRFFADWQKSGAGDRGQFAPFTRYTSEAANRAFDDTYSEAFYKGERDKIERMFKDDIPGTKSKVSGKEMTVLEYIAENGNKLGPKAKASLTEKYGDGILRYFGVPQ